MLHCTITNQPELPMNAKPYPGLHAVGGANPDPWDALAWTFAEEIRRFAGAMPAPCPADPTLALLARAANQAITQQISLTYALADLLRQHAKVVTEIGTSRLPAGPLRSVLAAAAESEREFADSATTAASAFGRRFGHLAFAFPAAA
jgi:hypothetical protein